MSWMPHAFHILKSALLIASNNIAVSERPSSYSVNLVR
jgi:hypothetical protein